MMKRMVANQTPRVPTKRVQWARAFAEQGAADLAVSRSLVTGRKLHVVGVTLLQSAMEKLGKATLLLFAGDPVVDLVKSHRGAVRMMRLVKAHPKLRPLAAAAKELTPAMTRLEALHPALSKGNPNIGQLEYPWEVEGEVVWPDVAIPVMYGLERQHHRGVQNARRLEPQALAGFADTLLAQLRLRLDEAEALPTTP